LNYDDMEEKTMSTSFPVFGSDGKLEGDLARTANETPSGTILPQQGRVLQPSMEYSDPMRLAEQREAETHRLLMQLMPERTKASDALERANLAVRQWMQVVSELQTAVSRARNLAQRASMSMDYEDQAAGTRPERFAALQAQLNEATEELGAAVEEQTAARELFERLARL
jgi:hypothetical protein